VKRDTRRRTRMDPVLKKKTRWGWKNQATAKWKDLEDLAGKGGGKDGSSGENCDARKKQKAPRPKRRGETAAARNEVLWVKPAFRKTPNQKCPKA